MTKCQYKMQKNL